MAAFDLSWDQAVYDLPAAPTTAQTNVAQSRPTGGALGSVDTPSFLPTHTETLPAHSAGDPWAYSDPWLLAQRDLRNLSQQGQYLPPTVPSDPLEAQRQQLLT